jgi:phosphocarrier protein
MTTRHVTVPWEKGLHLRAAVRLVRLAQGFQSTISVRCQNQVANLRSIVSIVSLCAVMGTVLDFEITGDDEQAAASAVEQVFSMDDDAG